MAGWTGLEPAASGVTGRRYNQLNYHPLYRGINREGNSTFASSKDHPYFKEIETFVSTVGGTGLEPATSGL